MRAALLVMALALSASTARAQSGVPTGEELAAMLPERLGRAPRAEVSTYSRFVSAAYTLRRGGRATLQLHEVIGAGSEAFQRSDCPNHVLIARRSACLRVRDGHASVSWVLDDTVQVILLAPDELTATVLARALDLRELVRLAARLREAARASEAGESTDEADVIEGHAASPPPMPSTPVPPRPRLVSISPPVFPPEARAQGMEGAVTVRVDVGADGVLTNARVMSGDTIFHEAALACVRGARFEAARDADGHAVAAIAVVRVRFAE